MVEITCIISDSLQNLDEKWTPVIDELVQRSMRVVDMSGRLVGDNLTMPDCTDLFAFASRIVCNGELRRLYCILSQPPDQPITAYVCTEEEADALGINLPQSGVTNETINNVLGQIKNAGNN
jgi:hypothetical protein